MSKPPKVTRVEFADGKVVRFRQEGEKLLIEWKTKGGDWKALDPVMLEPFMPGARPYNAFEQAEANRIRQEMERDLLTGRPGQFTRSRVVPRQPNQGAVVDFATITSTMPDMRLSDFSVVSGDYPINLRAGDRIGIDVRTSEAVPEGGMFLRVEDEILYRAADGTVGRWEDIQGAGGAVYRTDGGSAFRYRDGCWERVSDGAVRD